MRGNDKDKEREGGREGRTTSGCNLIIEPSKKKQAKQNKRNKKQNKTIVHWVKIIKLPVSLCLPEKKMKMKSVPVMSLPMLFCVFMGV